MRIYLLAAALVLAGCASERTSSASAVVADGDYGTIFRNVTSAAVSAGFTIRSARVETGQITAAQSANTLLNSGDAVVNITVTRAGGGAQISVASAAQRTVGGQILDTGDPRESMQGFCRALLDVIPGATCTVQQAVKK